MQAGLKTACVGFSARFLKPLLVPKYSDIYSGSLTAMTKVLPKNQTLWMFKDAVNSISGAKVRTIEILRIKHWITNP